MAVAPEDDILVRSRLAEKGIAYHVVPMSRAGLNPLADLQYLRRLTLLLRRLQPDLTLSYTIKPVVYGLIASRFAGVSRRFALITGLGYAFTNPTGSLKRRLIHNVASGLYRFGLRFADGVFFQNPDDRALFQDEALIARTMPTWLVNGSGVDTNSFARCEVPPHPSFLFVGRLLRDKGVLEYVEAARRLKASDPHATCHLVGPVDPNPSGISSEVVSAWVKEGIIEYHGAVADVRPWLHECSVFVLPSYREGTPRSVLEAMSVGRAIITTDAPGCRETVENGINGLLVLPGDAQSLYDAMMRLARDEGMRTRMATASRLMAERKYDVHTVNAAMLAAMELGRAS